MSIIIKGQDKPLVCNECPCWDEEYTRCRTNGNYHKGDVYYAPPEWCPIEELPEEGLSFKGARDDKPNKRSVERRKTV